ncbi:MAG: endonuclease/exonuclease/phosphatase family protein [Solirubrobacteraceae bacterium]|nr:endonuclease/exonuclease/phosphatase family protein [Solirubrobacteraceae bacterium]
MRATRLLLGVAALLWVPWLIATTVDIDARSWRIPAAVAFLPYVVVLTAVVLVVAALLRSRAAAIGALIGLVVLGIPRLGRLTHDDQPAARGPIVTIATGNVLVGHADPTFLARLVRGEHVDLLAIQENTPEWDAAARRAGLLRTLTHGATDPDPRPGAAGLALWSRWPITRLPAAPGDHRSLGGLVNVPGAATPVHVRSVHPPPPFNARNVPCWKRCTRAFRHAADATGDALLVGDFNATLDHHPIRSLLGDDGFRDAAEEAGAAWRPTWSNGSWATLTIDHVLATRRIAIEGVTVHDLPGSDHDVVVARVRLPR